MQVQISLFSTLLILCSFSNANQITYLHRRLVSRKSQNSPVSSTWALLDETRDYSPVYVAPQEGLMQADKIDKLPGQPDTVDFDQYAGYVTVDPAAERALFYYFVESPTNSSTNPLVLWLNGGPGCSSLGYGAMEELGPFRVNTDGRTLSRNNYAWNNVANVIFLESPAGVGFSYTKMSSPYNTTGDKSTASDAYTFLLNWFERFPQYKTREFYITGESYSGHYVPQLSYTILLNNKNSNHTVINLKGIAMGNAWIEDLTSARGIYDYFWTHALISDETHNGIVKFCGLLNGNLSDECWSYADKTPEEIGNIEINNIYAPVCLNKSIGNSSVGSVNHFDPCSDTYVEYYLNNPDVQNVLHTRSTNWTACRQYNWTDSPDTVLPVIKDLIGNGLRIWIYRQVLFYIKAFFELDFVDVVYVELKDNDLSSGDIDANVPVTSSRYSISSLKLPIRTAWHPWYLDNEVGGYVVEYEGLTFVTVRGAGHLVPSYQPQRALTMISSFLQGILLPST